MEEEMIADLIERGADPTFAREFLIAINKHKILSELIGFVAHSEKYSDEDFMMVAAQVYSFVKFQESQMNFG